MLLVKGFDKFFNAAKENNGLEIKKRFYIIYIILTSLMIFCLFGFDKVVNTKVNNWLKSRKFQKGEQI